MSFGDVANVISVISGLMTILGISGIVSWSLFTLERGSLAQNSISVFAVSVKLGVCMLLLWPTFALFFATHLFIVLSTGPGAVGPEKWYWDSAYPGSYAASYLVNTLLWGPIYMLGCACVLTWSTGPLRRFWATFRGQRRAGS